MIAIGSDHGGFELKAKIIEFLKEKNVEVKDYGCYNTDSIDYPDVAKDVCQAVVKNECERGILVCGTGIGISIAANKVRGIRAALCHSSFDAKMCRMHNDANVLCLGGRTTGPEIALEIVNSYLSASFEGGRHAKRVEKIMSLED
ncbi:MAG: ribose 5-phosphate isomerase B [Ruminococcaceae bacterium]|nr:ribose 5-phosphate isomerase B [Oscillospiraceae bacterium]